MSDPELLRPKELGEKIGVRSVTILEWYHAGKIPAEVAEGRIYLFNLSNVLAALAKRASKENA